MVLFTRFSSLLFRNAATRRVLLRSFRIVKTNNTKKLNIITTQHPPFFSKLVAGASLLVGFTFISHSFISKCDVLEQSEGVARLKEESTGVEVTKKIFYGENGTNYHEIIGIGVRRVTFLKIQAYTLALYLPPKTIQEIQQKWKGIEINAENSQKMLNDVLEINGDFTLRMVPVKQVGGSHVYQGFFDSIKRKLEKDTVALAKIAPSEKEFQALLPNQSVYAKDTLIDFVKIENNFHIFINGINKGKISDPLFSKLFLDVVLGEGSKLSDPKKEFVKGLQQLVK